MKKVTLRKFRKVAFFVNLAWALSIVCKSRMAKAVVASSIVPIKS
jgi:hypothetical protein